MRNIAMSHLLPAVTSSTVSGLTDHVLSASLRRGACLGGLAGIVYSVTYDILDKKFEVQNGLIKHSMAVITSAVLTFGAAFIASAAGVMAMPSLAGLSALLLTAIAVNAIFRFTVDGKPNDTNNESPVSPPAKQPAKVEIPAQADPFKATGPVADQLPPANAAQNAAIPAFPTGSDQPKQPVPSVPKTGAGPVAKGSTPPQNAVPKAAAQPNQPASGAAVMPSKKAASPATSSSAPVVLTAAAVPPATLASHGGAQAVASAPPASPSGVAQSPQLAASVPKVPPLIEALKGRQFDVAESLINKENANCEDKDGTTALAWSVRRGQKNLAEKLISLGAKTDCANTYKWTLLHQAAYSGNIDVVIKFQTGADLEVAASLGHTPLAVALAHGHEHIVQHLLANGAKKDFKLSNGNTPLHVAIRGGSKSLITMMMATKEYLNVQNDSGATPLADALMFNRIDSAKEMVQKRAKTKTKLKNQKTLLHIAAEKCDPQTLEWVHGLGKKALDEQDVDGNTPLLLSIMQNRPENAVWLLNKGAKGNCKNKANETPYTLAEAMGFAEVLKALADKGIKS